MLYEVITGLSLYTVSEGTMSFIHYSAITLNTVLSCKFFDAQGSTILDPLKKEVNFGKAFFWKGFPYK